VKNSSDVTSTQKKVQLFFEKCRKNFWYLAWHHHFITYIRVLHTMKRKAAVFDVDGILTSNHAPDDVKVILCDEAFVICTSVLQARAPVLWSTIQCMETETGVVDLNEIAQMRDKRAMMAVLNYCAIGDLPGPSELAQVAEEFRFWGVAQTHPQFQPLIYKMSPLKSVQHFLKGLFNTTGLAASETILMSCDSCTHKESATVWRNVVQYGELLRQRAFIEYGVLLTMDLFHTTVVCEDVKNDYENEKLHTDGNDRVYSGELEVIIGKIREKCVAAISYHNWSANDCLKGDRTLILKDEAMQVTLSIKSEELHDHCVTYKLQGLDLHRYSLIGYEWDEFVRLDKFLNDADKYFARAHDDTEQQEMLDDALESLVKIDYTVHELSVKEDDWWFRFKDNDYEGHRSSFVLVRDCQQFSELFQGCGEEKYTMGLCRLNWTRLL
jgi:hypothetical protein